MNGNETLPGSAVLVRGDSDGVWELAFYLEHGLNWCTTVDWEGYKTKWPQWRFLDDYEVARPSENPPMLRRERLAAEYFEFRSNYLTPAVFGEDRGMTAEEATALLEVAKSCAYNDGPDK